MKAEIKGKDLVITIPINSPAVTSKSGKSLVVASSNGNLQTDLEYEGKKVVIGLNAYIKRD